MEYRYNKPGPSGFEPIFIYNDKHGDGVKNTYPDNSHQPNVNRHTRQPHTNKQEITRRLKASQRKSG